MSKKLNGIDIVTCIVTLFVVLMIMYLEMRNMLIRLVWNDMSRTYTSESIISYIYKQVRIILILGVANIVASFVNVIC